MNAQTFIDPAVFTDRACSGTGQETFFPDPSKRSQRSPAVRLCQACPVLQLCAAYAVPLVEDRAIAECVIASVYVPSSVSNAHYNRVRTAAIAQLKAIAAEVTDLGEVAA
ncbi:WhiB family transcriptional regulator [Nocardia sp. NPDC087230]|uniref:WhiB family transcriptional regulator n=1 Tax=Nocardia sp. NPDC087230 TaxID=3364331 RepID=UPI003822FD60